MLRSNVDLMCFVWLDFDVKTDVRFNICADIRWPNVQGHMSFNVPTTFFFVLVLVYGILQMNVDVWFCFLLALAIHSNFRSANIIEISVDGSVVKHVVQ